MYRIALFLSLVSAAAHACAVEQNSTVSSQTAGSISYPTVEAATSALRAKAGVRMREENDWLVFADPSEDAFWSITTPANPAHPTMVKRRLVEQNGEVKLLLAARCGAPKPVCDQVVQRFRDDGEAIAKSLRAKR